jgi:hypothetical protein
MEPAPAISTCMRASLNWRVRCTHASLPPLAFFIFLYERSGFVQESLSRCSHWRASASVGGPNLLTSEDIYHIWTTYFDST